MSASSPVKNSETNPQFAISRSFDAPRDIVWKAWTEGERIAKWFGPKGFSCRIAKLDLRPGGTTHSWLKSPEGIEMWGKFTYREITPPSKLVWIHSFSDANLGTTRHPFVPNWPLELLTTVIFEEQNAKTKITLTWTPHNASEIERQIFAQGTDSMNQGWGGTFDQLAEYLRNNQ